MSPSSNSDGCSYPSQSSFSAGEKKELARSGLTHSKSDFWFGGEYSGANFKLSPDPVRKDVGGVGGSSSDLVARAPSKAGPRRGRRSGWPLSLPTNGFSPVQAPHQDSAGC